MTIAWVFPGQGSQKLGMANSLIDLPGARDRFELASEIQGIVGTAIIGGKATEIIDVAHYMAEVFGGLGGFQSAENEAALAKKKSNVLLIDDSAFFLNMLKPLLSAAGYRVTAVDNAQEALSLRDQGYDFDVIVSDIEMPEMDGYTLTAEIKADPVLRNMHVVLHSSLSGVFNEAMVKKVGADQFIAKFHPDELASAVQKWMTAEQ